MAPISLRRGKADDLAKELVQAVANLKSGTENCNIAVEFAVSNFRFHRFLDVNSLEVSRQLDGLRNKFIIHCQDIKAKQLESLKEDYLKRPFSSSLFETNTEYHFGILSLLLCLSQSPVNCGEFSETRKDSVLLEESIDWKEYLLSGEDKLELGIDISEEQRLALEETDEDDDHFDIAAESDKKLDRRLEPVESSISDAETSYQTECDPEGGDVQWLQRNITSQYWKGETAYLPILQDKGGLDNENKVMSAFKVMPQDSGMVNYLTENAIVRETLWMLQGIRTTYVYRYVHNNYFIREDICLSHISQTALKNSLGQFAAAGNKVQELKMFVADSLDLRKKNMKIIRAFAYAVNCFLKKTRKDLGNIECKIVSKNEVYTILTLEQAVGSLLSDVALVYEMYKNSLVMARGSEVAPNECLVHVVDSLFNTVCNLDAFGSAGSFQVGVLIPIFLETIRPFLSDLAFWISSGKLPIVGREEFFVCEDEIASEDDSTAWRQQFRIRRCQDDDIKLAIPHFLAGLTDKILLTGKSCRVLERAGKSFTDKFSSVCETELFESLLKGLGISCENHEMGDKVEIEEVLMVERNTVMLNNGFSQLLEENFLVIFQRNYQKFINSGGNNPALYDNFQSTMEQSRFDMSKKASCRQPFSEIFKSSLQSLIDARYSQASNALLGLLKDEIRFMHHFGIIKNFFLMEAGDVMSSFYSEIFTKIRRKEFWQSTSYLTSVLHDALQLRFPTLVDRLTAGIKSDARGISTNVASVQSAASIYLHYEMDWPLTIIFDSKAEEKYNAIFSFLLQVKRAVWSLEQLRIAELWRGDARDDTQDDFATPEAIRTTLESQQPATAVRQKMYVLRVKLLHFVQSFHVYIMTRILHSSGLEFKAQVSEAKDFDEIVTIHLDFLEKVYDRCLLSPKVGFAKEAITRILNLCLNFQSNWDLGLTRVKVDEIASIDKEFTKCSHFIQSFLNNLMKRGSFPHLELLSLSLRT